MAAAGCTDEEMDQITWANVARFFDHDVFAVIPREQATVGALRAGATDVDTTVRSKREWAARYEARTTA